MNIFKKTFFIAFGIGACLSLYGENINEASLRLLKGSPEYKNEEANLRSLEAALKISSNLPDPEISAEYLFAPGSEPNRWGAELSWGLEWPGVYGARSREAKSKMAAAYKALYLKRVDRLLEIKKLLLEYILCQQRLALLEELNNNNDSIYRLSEQMARGGELTALDLNKVRLEYANIRGAQAGLMSEKSQIESSLSEIFGGNCGEILSSLECQFPAITLPSGDIVAQIGERSALKEQAQMELEAARAAQNVARHEALPSLSIGYKHAYEDMVHFNGPTLGISLPLFSSRGKQKAAKAAIEEAELNMETAMRSTEASVEMALRHLQLLKTQIEEIEPILKNSDHNNLLLKAYKGGTLTLVEYLTERNYFTTAASEFLDLKYQAAVAQTELMKYFETEDF